MPTNIIMPQMGESVAEGTITRWMKKVGDHVDRDEPLFEISTDKVDAEIPSPAAGILSKILVQENQTVEVNTVVAEIDGEGAAAVAPASSPALESKAPPASSPAQSAEVQPQTAPEPPTAAASGPPAGVAAAPPPATNGEFPPQSRAANEIRSSPLVRKIAMEHNVDLSQVQGTGLGGRISKKDIMTYLASGEASRQTARGAPQASAAPASLAAPIPSVPPAASITFTGPTQSVPLTPMRRQIAEHMVASKRTSAHVNTFFEVEMTKVAEVLARSGPEFEKRNGVKLTYTPFFVRAAVEALKQFPIVNSSLEGDNILYRRNINIGVAVALETGLIVPVIKHADEKSFLGVARSLRELAERARTKRLSVDDVQEGTFTLTNPGIFGSLMGTPIINQPQVAILGVGVIEKRPVVRNDAIAIRTMVYLALSFDHRVLDGAIADQFMGKIKSVLENWDESVL
jgi:pyruvate dehydrogenase E2 component (dihydrolipoamide acetyltransferase)